MTENINKKCEPEVIAMLEEVKKIHNDLSEKYDIMSELHKINQRDIDDLKKAFPDNDYEGHKRYHKTMIDMLEEKRKLRRAVQEKTISGLIWLGIVSVGSAIYHEIIRILGR